ncbi:PQQ-binding-like beta-propeller repeat protein [Amycolatopsis sp. NPDC051071]|uniref:outer membrane protein assembly factor BamB family protein n=1 Tax=Amycolatopsis sp. NPDC051071 TaxID=3154637 RepID=UPI0034470C46
MGAVIAALAAGCAVVAAFLSGDAARTDRPDPEVAMVAAALVLAALLAFGKSRWVRISALVVAAGATGWASYCLSTDLGSGTPGNSTGVLTVAAVISVAATGLTVRGDRARPLRWWLALPLVVVLAAGTVAAAMTVPSLAVRSVTTAAVVAPALADRVKGTPWKWTSPTEVRDVVAAGAGVAVAGPDGDITALDGPTGAVRWTYARPGAHLRALVATPDLHLLLAVYGGDGRDHLTVLDAFTGVPLQETLIDEVRGANLLAPTATVLPSSVYLGNDNFRVDALDLRTGSRRWTWTAPEGCVSPFALPASGRDVVLAPLLCPDRLSVLGLDERTGTPRWEHRLPVTRPSDEKADFYLHSSPDGETVSLALRYPGLATGNGTDVVLAAATGAIVSTMDPRAPKQITLGPVAVSERDENGKTTASTVDGGIAVDLAACPVRLAHSTTPTAYLRLCALSGGRLVAHRQELDGSPASTLPIDWPPGTPYTGFARPSLIPAPGALVAARGGAPVIGYPAR